MQLVEDRLVLERVHLAHAALHEQEDAVLRLAVDVWFLWCKWIGQVVICFAPGLIGQHRTEREGTDAVVRGREESSAGRTRFHGSSRHR